MDRWDVLCAVSATSLSAGVWAQWGWTWAAMLVGALGLAVAGIQAYGSRPSRRA